MNQVFRKGFYDEISLDAISKYLEDGMVKSDSAQISQEQIEEAHKLLELAESRRQENMKEYYQKKHKGLMPLN